MPDTYKVFATNQPEKELEVDAAELVDLSRHGLLIAGKGDISRDGALKRAVAADAPTDVVTATGPVPTIQKQEG